MIEFFSQSHLTWTQYWHVELLIVMFCLGWHTITREGMIFNFYSKMIKDLPDIISFPLGECPYCMPSFHGSIVYALYFLIAGLDVTALNFLAIIPLAIMASPISGWFYNILKNTDEGLSDEQC